MSIDECEPVYTVEEINSLVETLDAAREANTRLLDFLDPVAKGLGYDGVSWATADDGDVTFRAFWDGPYQSHDEVTFEFPTGLLTRGPTETVKFLKARRDNEQKRAAADAEATLKAERLEQYRRLKAEFENAGG